MRKTLVIMVACVVFSAAMSFAAEKKPVVKSDTPVELGRQGKATPWLKLVEDPDRMTIISADSIDRISRIPHRTDYYEIDPDVVVSGYFYTYYVRGKYSDYVVNSTIKLAKLLAELGALEELRKRDPGGEFFIGIGQSVAGMGKGLANLVARPQKTFRSLGTKIGRAFKTQPKIGKDESGADRSLLGEGPAGANRRHIAYKMNIDVYTDNPDLQHVLNTVARSRVAGEFAGWAIPGETLGVFQTLLRDEATEKLIRDQGPKGVRIEMGKALGPLLGLDKRDPTHPLGRFLQNPNYTPRQVAYLGYCLRGMAGTAGLDKALDQLSRAETPEEADLFYMEMRCFHRMHITGTKLREFMSLEHSFAAMGEDNILYAVFPGDYLDAWDFTPAEVNQIIAEARNHQAAAIELKVLGDVEPAFMETITGHGLRITPNAFMLVDDAL